MLPSVPVYERPWREIRPSDRQGPFLYLNNFDQELIFPHHFLLQTMATKRQPQVTTMGENNRQGETVNNWRNTNLEWIAWRS